MSFEGCRPEHMIVREYVAELLEARRFTWDQLTEAFVTAYGAMIPAADDVSVFEPVHVHDPLLAAERKHDANLKKLRRKLLGQELLPLCYVMPLVVALDAVRPGENFGTTLHKALLHNAGVMHMPINVVGDAYSLYGDFLKEIAEANSAIIKDLSVDNRINEDATREELLQAMEAMFRVLRRIDDNQARGDSK